MTSRLEHITVCICTYKRPELLQRLLNDLGVQETDGQFTYSIVVVDNDKAQSAQEVVTAFAAASSIAIKYCFEPRQNIALARNKAIENAPGDYACFIDDDEFPIKPWLLTLYQTCQKYKVDGVLGPVKPYFEDNTPQWVVKGKFYDRPSYPTGMVIDWRKGRTGNTFLKTHLFADGLPPFNPEFRQGEDQEFFSRMIAKGHVFVWCDEAVAYEVVPPVRWKRSFMLRRALLRGSMEPKAPSFGIKAVMKAMVAVPIYVLLLPFMLIAGHHKFMKMLVSLFDHLGLLLATVGINPVKEQYVTE